MPFLILIACAWIIGTIIEKALKRHKLKQLEEEKQASIAKVNAAMEAERANRERIAREKQMERERIARQKAIDAANKARLAAEKEKAAEAEKQRKKEFAEAQARTTIEHYVPIRKQLEKELQELNSNPNGKSAEQIEKKRFALEEKIFQIDRKLEKADFTLNSYE